MKNLGDRMKYYEHYAGEKFMPGLPILVRLDGRNFHNWTKGCKRPYDAGLSELMQKTTKYLVEVSNATIGYTQSDEISLVFANQEIDIDKVYFGGKKQKIISMLAVECSLFFNQHKFDVFKEFVEYGEEGCFYKAYAEYGDQIKTNAMFDCRAWQVPNLNEAFNYLLWRERDATKNSVSMAAQHYFSHKSLQGLHQNEQQEKLFQEAGVNWNDYPDFFKRGSYVKRKTYKKAFAAHELLDLPPKHEAHKNPDLVYKRTVVEKMEFPPISQLDNLVEMLFN